MSKARGSRRKGRASAGMEREYRFDYRESRPNRFARRIPRDAVVIVLDADVAKVVRDPKQVNALLRAAIVAVRKRRPRRAG